MDGTNQAALLGLDATIFSAVGSKINDGSNNVGLNKAGEFRFYVTGGTPTCQLDLSVVTGYSIVSVTPNVTSGTLKVFVGENEVTATSGVFAVNSTSVTFSATGSSQAKVKSIAITYKTI